MDINKLVIIGRLTKEPELRTTTGGKSLCKFSIAVNGYKDEVGFFDCIAWDKTAETIAKYVRKGQRIGIDGSIKFSSWESDGKKRSKVEINVDRFQFLDKKADGTESMSGPVSNATSLPFSKEPMNDNDIPF